MHLPPPQRRLIRRTQQLAPQDTGVGGVAHGAFGREGEQGLRVLREELVDGGVEADEDGEGFLLGLVCLYVWISRGGGGRD